MHWSVTQWAMTRQLCVYIKRARGTHKNPYMGKQVKNEHTAWTRRKNTYQLALRKENTPYALRLGSQDKKFSGISKFLGSLQYFFTAGIQPNIYKNSILLPRQPTKHSAIMWYYEKSLAMTTVKRLYCWIIREGHQRPNASQNVRNVANGFFLCFRRLFGLRPTLKSIYLFRYLKETLIVSNV